MIEQKGNNLTKVKEKNFKFSLVSTSITTSHERHDMMILQQITRMTILGYWRTGLKC